MTQECVRSLLASEVPGTFRIVVVETQCQESLALISDGQFFGECCQVIYPGGEFNYNRFLQAGYEEVQQEAAPYLLVCNNDLVFEAGFATELRRGLETYDSVTPWCPGYHDEQFSGPSHAFYEGYRTRRELCGWALMLRRNVLERVPFARLFPVEFAFWFQDDWYGVQLQRHGLRHALVRQARVQHLAEQSHHLIPEDHFTEWTTGAEDTFWQMVQLEDRHPQLTILVTIPLSAVGGNDLQCLRQLLNQSRRQGVEVLALLNNGARNPGAHLQRLAQMAHGEFLAPLAADDHIVENYVEILLQATSQHRDAARGVSSGTHPARSESRVGFVRASDALRWSATEWDECLISRYVSAAATVDDSSASVIDLPPLWREMHQAVTSALVAETAKPVLSICILTVPSRLERYLPTLLEKLERQAHGLPVELLVLCDNRTNSIGAKRTALLRAAGGQYLCFIDDDDDIAPDYVASLLSAIERHPGVDCVVFNSWVTLDGQHGRLCRFGLEYGDVDLPDEYLRRPNHLCCCRTDCVRDIAFDNVNWHEDFRWAAAIAERLQSQVRIPQILYFYRYQSRESEAQPPRIANSAFRSGSSPSPANQVLPESPDKAPLSGGAQDPHTWPVFGFLHVLLAPGWHEIVTDQFRKLEISGLLDRTERLFVGLVGGKREHFDRVEWPAKAKIEVLLHHESPGKAELPILEAMRTFCAQQPRECGVYYLHTKGITWPSRNAHDWRRLLEYFVIQQFPTSLGHLATHDICGVNWLESPTPHFSGNFFWARASYLAQRPSTREVGAACEARGYPARLAAEWWLAWQGFPRVHCLHNSEVNHYEIADGYPRARYAPVHDVPEHAALAVASAWRGLENRLQDVLDPLGKIDTVVELGVDYGYSLFALALAIPQARVIGIDPYDALPAAEKHRYQLLGGQAICGSCDAEATVRQHLANGFPHVELWKETSAEAARRFSLPIDVLHIDAAHTFADVTQDFCLWQPLVRPGGCVLFHNVLSFPQDVGRFFQMLPGRKILLEDGAGLGVWYKSETAEPANCAASRALQLSVCLIVRDAAQTLEACLSSIRPWVDEIVVVDTGSRDDTTVIAKQFTNHIFEFPWCDDFSAARNESLRHATGNWILWMDADDTISPDNGAQLRLLASMAPLSQGPLGYICKVRCPGPSSDGPSSTTDVDHVKLIRNLPDIRFQGRIHEQVLGAIRQLGGEIAWTEIAIDHSGSDQSPEGRQRKYERDLRILQLELGEQPEHPFTWFNLGMTYADMQDYDEAIPALERSLFLAQPEESHVRKAYALLVASYQLQGRFSAAEEACQRGLVACPGDTELLFRQGILHHHFGRHDAAVSAYQSVLAPQRERYLSSMDQGLQTYKARHNLALVYMAQGDYTRAAEQWRMVAAASPRHAAAWIGLNECLLQQERYDEAWCVADELLRQAEFHSTARQLQVAIAQAQHDGDRVDEILEYWSKERPDDIELLRCRCHVLWHRGPVGATLAALSQLAVIAPHDAPNLRNLAARYEQLGCYRMALNTLRRAEQLEPDSPVTATAIARCWERVGDNATALHVLMNSCAKSPDDALLQQATAEFISRTASLGSVTSLAPDTDAHRPRMPRLEERIVAWPKP